MELLLKYDKFQPQLLQVFENLVSRKEAFTTEELSMCLNIVKHLLSCHLNESEASMVLEAILNLLHKNLSFFVSSLRLDGKYESCLLMNTTEVTTSEVEFVKEDLDDSHITVTWDIVELAIKSDLKDHILHKIRTLTKNIVLILCKTLDDTVDDEWLLKKLGICFSSLVSGSFLRHYHSDKIVDSIENIVLKCLEHLKCSKDWKVVNIYLNYFISPHIKFVSTSRDKILAAMWSCIDSSRLADDIADYTEFDYHTLTFLLSFIHEQYPDWWSQVNVGKAVQIVRFGLKSTEPLCRKQCLFIIELLYNVCGVSIFSNEPTKVPETIIRNKTFDDYILCLNTLEQNQIHVVLPVFQKMKQIWKTWCQEHYEYEWLFIVYKRSFDHENFSVRQFAVSEVLLLQPFEESQWKSLSAFTVSYLLDALNDYRFFLTQICSPEESASEKMFQKIAQYFGSIVHYLSLDFSRQFIKLLFNKIFDGRTWEDVSLYHLLRAFAELPSLSCIDYDTAKAIVVASQDVWKSQEIVIRHANILNFALVVIKNLSEEVTPVQYIEIILLFGGFKFFCQHYVLWRNILAKSSTRMLELSGSASYCNMNPTNAAVLFAMRFEHSPYINNLFDYCEIACASLGDWNHKPHHLEESCNALKYLCYCFELLSIIFNDREKNKLFFECHNFFANFLLERIFPLIQIIFSRSCSNDIKLFKIINRLLGIFMHSFNAEHTNALTERILSEYYLNVNKAVQQLTVFEAGNLNYCVVYGLEFLAVHGSKASDLKRKILEQVTRSVLERLTVWLDSDSYYLNEDSSAHSYKHNREEFDETCSAVWSCVLFALLEDSSLAGNVLPFVIEYLPKSGRSSLPALFRVSSCLVPMTFQLSAYEPLVTMLRSIIFEHRSLGYPSFTEQLFSTFLSTLLNRCSLFNAETFPFVLEVCNELIFAAESSSGIVVPLSDKLVQIMYFIKNQDTSDSTNFSFDDIASSSKSLILANVNGNSNNLCNSEENGFSVLKNLCKGLFIPLLLFGKLPDRKQRALREATRTVLKADDRYRSNLRYAFNEAAAARCAAITFLLCLNPSEAKDVELAHDLVFELKNVFIQLSNTKRCREFGNSLTHRKKTRLLQAVLILLPLLKKDECRDLLDWASSGLVQEQQQASVRYLLEWLLSAVVLKWPSLAQILFELCNKSVEVRPGCIGSYLASLAMLCTHWSQSALLQQCMEFAMPWCMGQQYNTRLYAQVTVTRIWSRLEELRLTSLLDRFGVFHQSLCKAAKQSKAGKSCDALCQDFIFTHFCPVRHHTLHTVCYSVPRLAMLADDEWLAADDVLCKVKELGLLLRSPLPLKGLLDTHLESITPAPWVIKAASVGGIENLALNTEEPGECYNIQRKLVPWTALSKQLKIDALAVFQEDAVKPASPLIVVTSLLNKTTNLGGLCRTSEVLGAGKIVLPSLDVLHDPAFTGLSVSAHKWITLEEVKKNEVGQYIMSLREKGYIIVAVEQTAHSVCLTDFKFPVNSVILLGNEKEGIPCGLLQEVDVCVEIPQHGVTRSFNAHVAGALCIWEYAKQHIKHGKNETAML